MSSPVLISGRNRVRKPYHYLRPSGLLSTLFLLLAATFLFPLHRPPRSSLVHQCEIRHDKVINKRQSVPVRDLTCFLVRAFPIVLVSMVEVMVRKGGAGGVETRFGWGFIGSGGAGGVETRLGWGFIGSGGVDKRDS